MDPDDTIVSDWAILQWRKKNTHNITHDFLSIAHYTVTCHRVYGNLTVQLGQKSAHWCKVISFESRYNAIGLGTPKILLVVNKLPIIPDLGTYSFILIIHHTLTLFIKTIINEM